MANNWRITGDKYTSKAGNDGGTGGEDDPKASVAAGFSAVATNGDLIIGTGTYEEAISSVKSCKWKVDSFVKMVGDGANSFSVGNNNSNNTVFEIVGPMHFSNYAGVTFKQGQTSTGSGSCSISKVNVKSPLTLLFDGTNSTTKTLSFNDSVVESTCQVTGWGGANQHTTNIRRVIFFDDVTINTGGTTTSVINIRSCHFHAGITLVIPDNGKNRVRNGLRNCNINATISLNGHNYAIKDNKTGTPQDNGYAGGVKWLTEANLIADGMDSGDAAGWDAAVATCINRDPLFNNVSLRGFGVQANSPLLGRGVDGENIGGVYASFYQLNADDVVVESDNVEILEDGQVVVGDSGDVGYVIFASKPLAGGLVATLEGVNYLGGLNFNSSETGGTSKNKNVPDDNNYSSSDAGRNPNRLSIGLRWSNVPGLSVAPEVHNNGGLATADSWVSMELFGPPKVDDVGLGSGEKNYNPTTGAIFGASWVQRKITVRNDYAH